MIVRTYVKRHRMEIPLRGLPCTSLPRGVELVPWDPELLDVHAEVKWLAFQHTLDATLFPNLGRLEGCVQLMRTISAHEGFLPAATWVARTADGYCGCIQGVRTTRRVGMIQNLGVLAECRGQGIGRALLAAALGGFRDAGLGTAQLEVSARNPQAVSLYLAAGFRVRKTYYRETKAEYSEYAI